MKKNLFIGLGNVGSAFDGTRHNLGIALLRAWVAEKEKDSSWQVVAWREDDTLPGQVAVVLSPSRQGQVHCLFPLTMMNLSGQAVAAYLKKTSLTPADLLVIHDDVELPVGEMVVGVGGSAKGHNGVRSIQQEVGTSEFSRLRLGIGRPPAEVMMSDFVLQRFSSDEQALVQKMRDGGMRKLDEVVA